LVDFSLRRGGARGRYDAQGAAVSPFDGPEDLLTPWPSCNCANGGSPARSRRPPRRTAADRSLADRGPLDCGRR